MVRKSDRKTRLEKGTTEFTGFAAFATPLGGNVSVASSSLSVSPSMASSVHTPQSRTLSPVYTGSDADVALLLKKVSQKRDVVTKTRAVEELTERLFARNEPEKDNDDDDDDERQQMDGVVPVVVLSKQEQVAAVSHLLCLFVTKLAYDNAPSVKIALLDLMQQAVRHIPKAWIGWLYHQHPTLLGMLYCLQSDPISDAVRTAAHDLLTLSHQTLKLQQPPQESPVSLLVQKTTCAYVKETLAHARPQSLHDSIYGTKLGHSSSSSSSHHGREDAAKNKKQAANQKNSSNGDSHKTTSSSDVTDDMQERYERTIMGVLAGMQQLVRQYPETTTPTNTKQDVDNKNGDNEVCNYDKLVDNAIVFKCIHNNRFTFRHETYKLVTALCQYAPSLIQNTTKDTVVQQKVSSMMSTCLSSEKHPSNMSALLEMLLLYMSSFSKQDMYDKWNVEKGGLDEGLMTKLLGKLMRKGCYGDSPSRWAPNMLPILASLPTSSSCHLILKCMWEGHTVFSTSTDTALLLEALVECSTYLLLRRRTIPTTTTTTTTTTTFEEVGDEEGAKTTAQLFLNALSYHLTTVAPPSAMSANQTLAMTLCQDLVKLDQAALDRTGCALYTIREWFWGEAVGVVLNQAVLQEDRVKAKDSKRMVSNLVLALAKKIPETTGTTDEDTATTTNNGTIITRRPLRKSHVNPLARSLFQKVLKQYQNMGNKSPDLETSRCLEALLAFSGTRYIFDIKNDEEDGPQRPAPQTAIERFCANDLLRFMMLRSSPKHKEVFKAYFRILSHCMHALEEESVDHQTLVWESLLRELIRANCDLSLLATGLVVLSSQASKSMKEQEASTDMLQCDVLDSFAIQVGSDATAAFHNYIDSQRDALRKEEKDLSDSDDNDDIIGHEASDRFTFLSTLAGLSHFSATLLVGSHVVKEWIKQACQSSDKDIDCHQIQQTDCNELLMVLVSLALSYPSTLNQDEIEEVLMEAWRQGGSVWYDTVQRFTKKLDSSDVVGFDDEFWGHVYTNFVKKASTESQQSLSHLAVTDSTLLNENEGLGTKTCQVWASRALRLLEISSRLEENSLIKTSDSLLPGDSISLVGLDNVELWKAALLQPHCAPGYLYHAFSILLQNAKESSVDATILMGSRDKSFMANSELMVLILMCVSKDPMIGTSSWVGEPINHTPSMYCLALLGDRSELVPFLDSWCRETISLLSVAMRTLYEKVDVEATDPNIVTVRCGVHVLFLLIDMMFGVYTTGLDDNLVEESVDARNVKEGDSFYYSKSSNGSEVELPRVHVKVMKVHKDDFPNLYFTIRPTDESQGSERQTVASRLKTRQFPPTSRPIEDKAIDKRERQNMEDIILSRLVKPYLEASSIATKNQTVLEAAAECINIMVSRCGLTGKGGLGTTRYDVFQILSSIERKILNSLAHSEDQVSSLRALQLLSSAMGAKPQFSATAVANNVSILNFDPLPITKAIVQFYELNGSQQHDISLDMSVLVWVSVSVSSIKDSDIIEQLFCLLSTMCSNIFDTEGGLREQAGRDNGKASEISYLLMKALYEMETRNLGMEPSDSEEQLLAQVIGLFATVMDSDKVAEVRIGAREVEDRDQVMAADKAPAWKELFVSLLRRNASSSPKHLLTGASMYAERLCAALFDPNKQWCSYQILTTLSKESSPLFPDEEGAVNHHSEKHLDSWKQALAEEEAEELHDDVHAAAKWLPHRLMNEVESWSGSTSADFNYEHEAVMGRMLSWLLCLEFMDSAASVDMRNRACISSYLDRTGAVGVVLELSLYLANVQKERSLDWMTCTSIDNNTDGGEADTFALSNVATLVVFRTVEALPTLAKSWWTDDCPRALQSPISQFVTNRVAPETLRRELSRIQKASTLGSMSVSGSCVSREVVATYMQDECTLSVMIRVPPTFPLRNVEVDCQKTLGIAEKRWRRWSLQIMRMLNSQDGSILDALLLWKQNVDKEFEGVEPCPVCYSVLCVKTHAMPNLECKTCQNRFHASCLFKWFQSSGKSQCVLCQQPWSGTKI